MDAFPRTAAWFEVGGDRRVGGSIGLQRPGDERFNPLQLCYCCFAKLSQASLLCRSNSMSP